MPTTLINDEGCTVALTKPVHRKDGGILVRPSMMDERPPRTATVHLTKTEAQQLIDLLKEELETAPQTCAICGLTLEDETAEGELVKHSDGYVNCPRSFGKYSRATRRKD